MKRGMLTILIVALLTLPVAGFSAEGMNHSGMQMDGTMIMLPMQSVDGINATVHLNDVKAAMAKMGMTATHHFMITLEDDNGEELVPQVLAVKVIDPSGKESEPVKLMSMAGHSGADITLATAGAYKFKVAAKMADNKKVQFDFSYTVK